VQETKLSNHFGVNSGISSGPHHARTRSDDGSLKRFANVTTIPSPVIGKGPGLAGGNITSLLDSRMFVSAFP
jgi:hypothetical protein